MEQLMCSIRKETKMSLQDGIEWEKDFGWDEEPKQVIIHTNKHEIVLSMNPKELSHWLKKSDKKYAKKLLKALKKELK